MIHTDNTLVANGAITKFNKSDFLPVGAKLAVVKNDYNIGEIIKSLHVKNEEAVIATTRWLDKSSFVSKLNYKLVVVYDGEPATSHQSNPYKVILSFTLADDYFTKFVLLKGLFDFVKPSIFAVAADRTSQSFTIEINSSDVENVIHHFKVVFELLAKEINFNAKLKELIKWERNKREQQLLAYSNLY